MATRFRNCPMDQFIADSWLAGIDGLEIEAHLLRLGVRADVAQEALSLIESLDMLEDMLETRRGCGFKKGEL